MRVLVAIPTLNEAPHIETVLRQIIEGDPMAAASEVLVLDGGSTDGTQAKVTALAEEFSGLKLLHNPGRTQAAALNMLLAEDYADVDVLIRADAHAAYPARFVERLVESLRANEAQSVVIPMDAVATEGCFQRGLAWIADTKLGAGGSPHRGGAASGYVDHGHHAAFDMATFRRLGGYDVRFIANEDAEYDRRVTESGGRIWLDAQIRIGYFPRGSARGLWRQYYRYGVGRAQTCLKHRIRPGLRQLIPAVHVILLGLSTLLLPVSPAGLLWPLVYSALVLAAGASMAIRRKSACGLYGALALAVMHTAWGLGFIGQLLRGVLAERKGDQAA